MLYLCIMKLNELKDIISQIAKNYEPRRNIVLYTGMEGMFLFDLIMKGIKLPKGIKYSHQSWKKLPGLLYINIGEKYQMWKIKIDLRNKIYSSYFGTVKLGDFNTIEEAIKKFKFNK